MERRQRPPVAGVRPLPFATVLALILGLALGACAPEQTAFPDPGPHKETIVPGGGQGSPLFSPIVRTGNLYFLSGVVGRSEDGDIGESTRRAMESVRDRLAAVDATMEDVVKCTVFLVDMDDYEGMNEVYVEFFPSDPPARSAIAVRELPVSAQVEVECIAAAR